MKKQQRLKSPKAWQPLTRAVLVLLVIFSIVGGVTFAALQSQKSVVRGNTIQTANANLQLSTDGANYSNSVQGFSFDNLIPGGSPAPSNGYFVTLKNSGNTALALKFSAGGALTNEQNIDLNKVHIILTVMGPSQPQTFSLQELLDADDTGGLVVIPSAHMAAGSTISYSLKVSMDSDALTASSASINNLDFNFNAVAVS